ncbi:MAG TPA: response regulator [Vicinamibacterales bacterium]|nr:response regulator [Vicinamibacterales bacterium]
MIDYPQLALRIPPSALEKLQALAQMQHEPQWRVLSSALDAYIAGLPADNRALIAEMVKRAEPVLQRAWRGRRITQKEPLTLLNVDDNEAMLFARSKIFRAEGFHVVEAQTGREALELARRHRPHVIVLDVHLPDINGVEICRQIKSDPSTNGIKVVQVSATMKTPKEQLWALAEGSADLYLTEPLPRGTLVSVVNRLLLESGALS